MVWHGSISGGGGGDGGSQLIYLHVVLSVRRVCMSYKAQISHEQCISGLEIFEHDTKTGNIKVKEEKSVTKTKTKQNEKKSTLNESQTTMLFMKRQVGVHCICLL